MITGYDRKSALLIPRRPNKEQVSTFSAFSGLWAKMSLETHRKEKSLTEVWSRESKGKYTAVKT